MSLVCFSFCCLCDGDEEEDQRTTESDGATLLALLAATGWRSAVAGADVLSFFREHLQYDWMGAIAGGISWGSSRLWPITSTWGPNSPEWRSSKLKCALLYLCDRFITMLITQPSCSMAGVLPVLEEGVS